MMDRMHIDIENRSEHVNVVACHYKRILLSDRLGVSFFVTVIIITDIRSFRWFSKFLEVHIHGCLPLEDGGPDKWLGD